MTLKEYVYAAAKQMGATPVESFGRYDFSVCAQHENVIFISDCGNIPCGECLSIGGGRCRATKSKLKLTVFSSPVRDAAQSDDTLQKLEMIYSQLEPDDSFCTMEFSVSEAKASASHKRIMREAYISATQLLLYPDIMEDEET